MNLPRGLASRLITDFAVGLTATGIFASALFTQTEWLWKGTGIDWLPVSICLGMLVAGGLLAGFREPHLAIAWVHALIIMAPELVLMPIILFSCHGFECTPLRYTVVYASAFTVPLAILSSAAAYARQRMAARSELS
jgi:hypothetical protein